MLRRSFVFRVLAGVAGLFGLRLSGGEEVEVWGAQVEILPQPQPMTVYARFVKRDKPKPYYVEYSKETRARTASEALDSTGYTLPGGTGGHVNPLGVANVLVVRGHRSMADLRKLAGVA